MTATIASLMDLLESHLGTSPVDNKDGTITVYEYTQTDIGNIKQHYTVRANYWGVRAFLGL